MCEKNKYVYIFCCNIVNGNLVFQYYVLHFPQKCEKLKLAIEDTITVEQEKKNVVEDKLQVSFFVTINFKAWCRLIRDGHKHEKLLEENLGCGILMKNNFNKHNEHKGQHNYIIYYIIQYM